MRVTTALLLALALLAPVSAIDPPPPPPRPVAALIIDVPSRPHSPVWVEIAARGLRVLDAIAPPDNGWCVYADEDAWCEVAPPARIVVRYAPRETGCRAGVTYQLDNRPAGWVAAGVCQAYLPAVLQ